MKVYQEVDHTNLNLWGQGYINSVHLTDDEIDQVLNRFEEVYPDGIDITDLNDIFTFEPDHIAEILGYENWEEVVNNV